MPGGTLVPVNELFTEFTTGPPRPRFPNVQTEIGHGSGSLGAMIYNNTLEKMIFNNTSEIMEYN